MEDRGADWNEDAPEADGGYVDDAADAPEPTIAAGLRSLKPWSALFAFAYLPLILILMTVWFWQCMFISLLILAPSLRLLFWWRRNSRYCPLDHLVSSYAQGFVVIFLCVDVSGLVAFVMASSILFVLCDAGFCLFFVDAVRFSMWVAIEEAWKLGFAMCARARAATRALFALLSLPPLRDPSAAAPLLAPRA